MQKEKNGKSPPTSESPLEQYSYAYYANKPPTQHNHYSSYQQLQQHGSKNQHMHTYNTQTTQEYIRASSSVPGEENSTTLKNLLITLLPIIIKLFISKTTVMGFFGIYDEKPITKREIGS